MATQISGEAAAAAATASAQAFTNATATDTSTPGIQQATVGTEQAALSSTKSVDLGDLGHVDNIVLSGSSNLDATGDQHDNLIEGNDGDNVLTAGEGNDTVLTGNGTDVIKLGNGNDTVIIDGSGDKSVNGAGGDDHFVILQGQGSHSTFTGLNIGDRLTVTVPDGNADGLLDFADVTLSASDNGSLTYNLSNGTSFTLDGVSVGSATSGSIKYDVVDNGDGTWTVDITG